MGLRNHGSRKPLPKEINVSPTLAVQHSPQRVPRKTVGNREVPEADAFLFMMLLESGRGLFQARRAGRSLGQEGERKSGP